jgi:hypothetical protein
LDRNSKGYDMKKTAKIFTTENIKRLRLMKLAGADRTIMAIAVGAKNANAFASRASQLGVFRQQPVEVAAAQDHDRHPVAA